MKDEMKKSVQEVGFEPTKPKHENLSLAPLTTREPLLRVEVNMEL